jgi:hypothetical protein
MAMIARMVKDSIRAIRRLVLLTADDRLRRREGCDETSEIVFIQKLQSDATSTQFT